MMVGFHHQHRVRYGECDMQQVVFNAHYLAFCDDAVDTWFRVALPGGFEKKLDWEFMLKKAVIEWQSPARLLEVIDMDVSIGRWGNTSFDVRIVGTVKDRSVFTATITYVGVALGTVDPLPTPDAIKTALSAGS